MRGPPIVLPNTWCVLAKRQNGELTSPGGFWIYSLETFEAGQAHQEQYAHLISKEEACCSTLSFLYYFDGHYYHVTIFLGVFHFAYVCIYELVNYISSKKDTSRFVSKIFQPVCAQSKKWPFLSLKREIILKLSVYLIILVLLYLNNNGTMFSRW